jgi:hypothetical protein
MAAHRRRPETYGRHRRQPYARTRRAVVAVSIAVAAIMGLQG